MRRFAEGHLRQSGLALGGAPEGFLFYLFIFLLLPTAPRFKMTVFSGGRRSNEEKSNYHPVGWELAAAFFESQSALHSTVDSNLAFGTCMRTHTRAGRAHTLDTHSLDCALTRLEGL